MKRVVITGMGVLAPNGHGLAAFTEALREGRSGVRFRPELGELNFACQIAAVPAETDALSERYFDQPARLGMDRYAEIGCIAGLDAWDDAGLPRYREGGVDWDTAICFGSGIGGIATIAKTLVPETNAGRVRRLGSVVPERIMGSAVSARLAGLLGIGGSVSSNSSACATGAEAIANGYWMIRDGRAVRVLAGGCEGDSVYTWAGFDAMRVLPRNFNGAPEQASRPLSATANGFVPGAGAGALVLEDLESAESRGARIYGEIIGAMANCGGQRNGGTMTRANPEGVQRCIQGAIRDAGIEPSDLDLISGHLTATTADPAELCNWRMALDLPVDRFPWVNAPKSMLGHTLGAAGAIESVATVLQIHEDFVHASINSEDLHPEVSWCERRIARKTQEIPIEIAAKASFGFGDVNVCLIFRSFDSKSTRS